MGEAGFKETDGGFKTGVMSVFAARNEGGKSIFDKPAPDAYKGQTRPITDFISSSRYGGPSMLGTRMLQHFTEGGGTVLYIDTECSLTEDDFKRMAEHLGFELKA